MSSSSSSSRGGKDKDKEKAPSIECEPLNDVFTDIDGNKFYTSLLVSGLSAKLGDFAKIRLEDDEETDELSGSKKGAGKKNRDCGDDRGRFGYCQILAIYDAIQSGDGVYIEARWFKEPHELNHKMTRKKLGLELLDNELVESDVLDDIPAGSICALIDIKPLTAKPTSSSSCHFICRYMESHSTDAMQKVQLSSIFDRGMSHSFYEHAYTSYLETQDSSGSTSNDKFSRAIRQLHISILPESLPCRVTEMEMISNFMREALKNKNCVKPVYISGMPGTGKTATVLASIANLKKEAKKGLIDDFDFVEINCLRLHAAADAYTSLWRGISGFHLQHKAALSKLASYFADGSRSNVSSRVSTVCLVDEIDFLLTKDENVIYNLFDWPLQVGSRLIIIGIANIMDLPERLSSRVRSRLGMSYERMVFTPYTFDQIQQILTARLQDLDLSNIFDQRTIEFLARKASTVAGDLRAALKICQKTIEILRDMARDNKDARISPAVVKQATDEYRESPLMAVLRIACKLDKGIMVCMCKDFKVTGHPEPRLIEIWERLRDFITKTKFNPQIGMTEPPYNIFESAVSRLKQQGFVKVGAIKANPSGSNNIKVPTVSLRMEVTDITAALRGFEIINFM